jgi:hypothetical protein
MGPSISPKQVQELDAAEDSTGSAQVLELSAQPAPATPS